jgi:hypothetical protein
VKALTTNVLRELCELIEYADNSCSEPDDFIRGMRFLFEAAAERLGTPKIGGEPDVAAISVSVQTPRIAARPVWRP